MKVITVQHKNVLEQLLKNGEYRASEENISDIMVKPYRFMQKHFGWKSIPIFLSPVGHFVEMGGAKFDRDVVAIELDIPDELCKVQLYYDWSDFIYFTEQPWEFKDAFNVDRYDNVEDWTKTIMDRTNHSSYNISDADKHEDALQVTVEFLKKDWIICTLDELVKLEEDHNDSGGANKLKELIYYS